LVRETEPEFLPSWDFIKPLFKERFGKRMDVAKIRTVLDNLKMDPQDHMDEYPAKMNSNFSQLRELIPRGQIVNIPENPANRTNTVCEGIHDNAIKHTHLQYLKYFFIAGQKQSCNLWHLKIQQPSQKHTKKQSKCKNSQNLKVTMVTPAPWNKKMSLSTKTHTVAIIKAVEDKAELHLKEHHLDEEDTMEMEANPKQEGIIKCKRYQTNLLVLQHLWTSSRRLRQTNPGECSMQRPQWIDLLAKTKSSTC